jgi:L-aspartate oxidase
MIGGVKTDLDGQTSVPGLSAVGECASSGLHGANRMGSNSLLEGLVLGTRAGARAADEAAGEEPRAPSAQGRPPLRRPSGGTFRVNIEDVTYSLKSLLWRQMGVSRTAHQMEDALDKIALWTRAVDALAPPGPRTFELQNMLLVARLAVESALFREESRGVHHRMDHPEARSEWRAHTELLPLVEGEDLAAIRVERVPVPEVAPTA